MNNHLETIEIKNFKCFKDFKAEGLKRVNLIGGKNNVGKTAFMEGCFINVNAINLKNFVDALQAIKGMRENLNILDESVNNNINYNKFIKEYIEQSNNIYTNSNLNWASFKIKDEAGIKQYIFEFNKQYIKVNINDFSYEIDTIKNIKFIDNFGLSNSNIITLYSSIQKKKEEQFLNDILNKFDDRIESFKVINNKPTCEIDGNYYEITEFGDGVRHLISIVTALFACEDGYLFIDEIDNGIHYTQLDEIWTIILEVSKKLNVQVFATTHSKECIESYARVAKKLEDEDISFIELGHDKNNELKAMTFPYKWFIDEVEQNHEVRGW